MSMALKYASTEDEDAMDTLKKYFKIFLTMNSLYVGKCAGKITVESCLILILLSVSLVGEIHSCLRKINIVTDD